MLKESLRKLGPEFGFLNEEASEAEQTVMNRLDRSVKLDEVDTITFGLETDDGKIVKVYVKVDQADDFEKALANKLGEIDDIEEVLNELSKEYEIVDVEWPDENPASDADDEENDGSDSLNKKVYDNPKEQAEADKKMKPKMEALTMGERLTISINEASDTGSLESRFTTASQLMVYHAMLELGIPEDALTRSSFRVEIMKNIKAKALELTGSPTMKSALKTFINRSIDYEEKASQNKDAMNTSKKDKPVKESLTEGITQDFWNAFLELVNYVAANPDDAKDLISNPTMKQIMTRSSAALSSNVTAQLKTKLNDFKNSLSGDGSAAQLKAAGVSESYLRATEKLTEGASPAEITDLFKALLTLADPSKDGAAADNAMKSSAWNSFFNAAKGSFSQKFGGPVRAKLNQLKSVLPTPGSQSTTASPTEKPTTVTPTAESRKSFATALNMLNMVGEEKSLKNATLAHSYQYGSEKFDEGHPVEVIGEEGDSYIVKAFPIMANSHMKMKKTAIKLTGKINVPVGGNNGKIEGGLDEAVAFKNGDRVKVNIQNWGTLRDKKSKGLGTVKGKEGKSLIVKIDDVAKEILVGPADLDEISKLTEETLNFKDSWRGQTFTKVKKHGTDKQGNTVYSGINGNGFPSVIVVGKDKKMVANSINDGSCKTPADAEKKAQYAVDNEVRYWDSKEPIKCYNLTHARPPELVESQVPDWSFDAEEDNVIIQCATIKILLDAEEVEKLIKGITNKDTVIVRDAEDQTHKVAFSPRGSSIMVKKVGTPEGVMMKQGDVDDLLDFVSKGEDDEEQDAPTKKTKPDAPEEDAQPAGGDESAVPKEQEKT
jgi:hypothetical protein